MAVEEEWGYFLQSGVSGPVKKFSVPVSQATHRTRKLVLR